MSLYNLLHGVNSLSDHILAMLNLRRSDVGRFRDLWVAENRIQVYTRNGGGNRECWHEGSNAFHATERCRHRVEPRMVEEYKMVPVSPELKGTRKRVATGRQILVNYYVCTFPDSIHCACPGCTIQYRLPAHPNYLFDRDDNFDSTYATIYFSFPEEYAEMLRAIQSDVPISGDAIWENTLANLDKFVKGK